MGKRSQMGLSFSATGVDAQMRTGRTQVAGDPNEKGSKANWRNQGFFHEFSAQEALSEVVLFLSPSSLCDVESCIFVAYSSRSRFGKHFIQVSAGVSSAGRSTWPTRNKPSSSTSLIYERKFWLLTRYPLQLQQLIEPKGWVLGRMKSLWSNDSRFTLTDRKRIFDRKYVFCHLRMSKHHVLITMITQQLSLSSLWRARKGIFLVAKVSFRLENEFLKISPFGSSLVWSRNDTATTRKILEEFLPLTSPYLPGCEMASNLHALGNVATFAACFRSTCKIGAN